MSDFQVIVVGGGPGGSAAAKKCAENGLKTLLLEKKKLPREKVCGGLFLVDLTTKLVAQEFGEIPANAWADPAYFDGDTVVHGLGPDMQRKAWDTRASSILRRNFDYWLNQKAAEKGAEIRDNAMVTSVREEKDGYVVEVEKEGKKQKLKSKFIVGADGATSMMRKYLYPDIKPRFTQCYQEWYEGDIQRLFNLERKKTHGFVLPLEEWGGRPPDPPAMYQKGDHFVVDIDTKMGDIKAAIVAGKRAIALCGINLPKPARTQAALIPSLFKELFSGDFRPARGNMLLIGDSAGLPIPISGEGMGTAMLSGLAAAKAITKSLESGEKAEKYYLKDVDDILEKFKQIYPLRHKYREDRDMKEVFNLTNRLF